VRAYRVADNQLVLEGAWDEELLAAELHALNATGFDLDLTGFDQEDLDRLLAPLDKGDGLAGEDDISEPPLNPVSRPGDLWLLGDHRLLCGDSTKPDDVVRVMQNHRAILFASDPPYLVDYTGTNHPSKPGWPDKNKDWSDTYAITWDDASQGPELYESFIKAAIEHAILPNAAWYCWHASRRQAMVESVWEKFGAFVHQQIVWAKDRGILTRSYYLWQHEPCFFGWLKGNKPPRVSDDYPSTVWNLPTVKVGEKTEHPTSKPIEVFAIPMRQHTKPGEVCYEPFSGSGSQIIAGEATGRRVYAIEISPQYVDVALKRWQTATGKHAELDADGRSFDEIAGERLPRAA
jgi:DNA modification methylase